MKVIFTCGGTAGHGNPALALAGHAAAGPQSPVSVCGHPPTVWRRWWKMKVIFTMGGFQAPATAAWGTT